MIKDELLEILRCPQDHSALMRAQQELVDRINSGISAGAVVNIAGQTIKKPIDAGLVRAAGDLMYPVVEGIPVMLPDEAIDVSQVVKTP